MTVSGAKFGASFVSLEQNSIFLFLSMGNCILFKNHESKFL